MRSRSSLTWLFLVLVAFGSTVRSSAAQEAAVVFDTPLVKTQLDRAPFRRMLDYDGDGDMDAFGYIDNGTASRWAAVYENDGTGDYSIPWIFGSNGNFDYASFTVGDFDGDGRGDFAMSTGNHPFSYVSFYTYDFALGFERTTILLGSSVHELAAGDLDGDGRDDLVYSAGLNVGVARASDGATFSAPHGFAYDAVHTIDVLDADGDGDLDILTGTNARLGLTYVDMSGDPVLTPGPTWSHGLGEPMLDAGDVDGDGDTDVALFDGDPATYRILRRTGATTWDLEPAVVGGPAEFLYDVDADGDLDGVCCGGGGTPQIPPSDYPSDFQIALNDGTGVFDLSFSIPGVGSPQLAGVEDVDGDGDVDLIAGRCIYYARGPITGPPGRDSSSGAPVVTHAREVGDFDGDGDMDAGISLTEVHMNDGTGEFHLETPLVMDAPDGVRFEGPGFPGDFDGDGDLDLLVEMRPGFVAAGKRQVSRATLGSNRVGTRSWLLRNDGSGALRDGGPAAPEGLTLGMRAGLAGLEARASLTADLDLDGDLDLVARAFTASSERRSRLWLNTGGGYFAPLVDLPTAKVEHVADLDLDGIPDLVTTRAHETFANSVQPSVLKGYLDTALPTYVPFDDLIVPLSVVTYFHPLAVDDVTGDGYPDIGFVRTIHPSENGTTSTTYEPALLVDTQSVGGYGYDYSTLLESGQGSAQRGFTVFGDVDGDGVPDVLTGPRNEGAELTEIHLNDPALSPGFQPLRIQVMTPGVLVDVDGDGDLDVLGERLIYNVSVP